MSGVLATRSDRSAAAEILRVPPEVGLRERKKARLRQQIIDTSIKLFRKHGYENTRIDDIVQILEISQPTFFRYFPSKDAVLREVGERGYACICERLSSELSMKAGTSERLRRLYVTMAREVEGDRQLWQAVVLSGAMDPVRSAELRGHEEAAAGLLREILDAGTETRRGDARVSSSAPGGVHGRPLRHRGATMGSRFDRSAQTDRPGAKRGGVFLARR